jgi:hypothetical protein
MGAAKAWQPKKASIAGPDFVFLILNSCEIAFLTMYRSRPGRFAGST